METGTNVAHPHTDRPLTPGAPASLCYLRDRSQSVVDRHTVVTLIAPRGRRLHVQEGSRTPPPFFAGPGGLARAGGPGSPGGVQRGRARRGPRRSRPGRPWGSRRPRPERQSPARRAPSWCGLGLCQTAPHPGASPGVAPADTPLVLDTAVTNVSIIDPNYSKGIIFSFVRHEVALFFFFF